MAWIESHQSLARHPKTLRLARALGRDVPTVIGHLHLLWWWALDYAPSGSLAEVTDQEVAAACQYRSDPGRLVDALTSAGFLEDSRQLHDWEDYTGRLMARRKATAARVRRHRAALQPSDEDDVTRYTSEEPALRGGSAIQDVTDYTTVPYSTVPHRT